MAGLGADTASAGGEGASLARGTADISGKGVLAALATTALAGLVTAASVGLATATFAVGLGTLFGALELFRIFALAVAFAFAGADVARRLVMMGPFCCNATLAESDRLATSHLVAE
jgi:hypothetical protein